MRAPPGGGQRVAPGSPAAVVIAPSPFGAGLLQRHFPAFTGNEIGHHLRGRKMGAGGSEGVAEGDSKAGRRSSNSGAGLLSPAPSSCRTAWAGSCPTGNQALGSSNGLFLGPRCGPEAGHHAAAARALRSGSHSAPWAGREGRSACLPRAARTPAGGVV